MPSGRRRRASRDVEASARAQGGRDPAPGRSVLKHEELFNRPVRLAIHQHAQLPAGEGELGRGDFHAAAFMAVERFDRFGCSERFQPGGRRGEARLCEVAFQKQLVYLLIL